MRRAERLFQIVQILRRVNRPVTAEEMAAELETSKRSVYRDIAALIGQRIPVRGEAGIGYVLEGGFDLPPLMLTGEEVEAAVLGAQWVAGHTDPSLAHAARDLIAKIAAVVPDELKPMIEDAGTLSPPGWAIPPDGLDVGQARAWIRAGRKLRIGYHDQDGAETRRTVWPFAIGYMETSRTLIAWCELREGFRSFRVDRVFDAEFLDDRPPVRPAQLRMRWLRELKRHYPDD